MRIMHISAPFCFGKLILQDDELFLLFPQGDDPTHDMGRLTQRAEAFTGLLHTLLRNCQQKSAGRLGIEGQQ